MNMEPKKELGGEINAQGTKRKNKVQMVKCKNRRCEKKKRKIINHRLHRLTQMIRINTHGKTKINLRKSV